MAAIAPSIETKPNQDSRHVTRTYGTGTANQADTLTTSGPNGVRKLNYVTIAYSAAPTHAGATVVIDSGLGSAYDTTLATSDANARYVVYIPDNTVWLYPDDEVIVSVPAGGSLITASVVICTEGK